MTTKILHFLLPFVLLFSPHAYTQDNTNALLIAFYNVENLFHPSNDTLTNDDAFTPTGLNHWSYKKYYKKINNIAKVIMAMGKGDPPKIIGLAEIECEAVLKDLCYHSPLRSYNYHYIHKDSPDPRGVDVAILYRDSTLRALQYERLPIVFPFEPHTKNRDMLHASFLIFEKDTLHLLVNHWTSRYGGYAATIPKRNYYAQKARLFCDSLFQLNERANIILMGDFNDYCTDESMEKHLQALPLTSLPSNPSNTIYNLMYYFEQKQNMGSHKHEDFWRCLDQIIVSQSLLDSLNTIHILDNLPHIFMPSFLVIPDEKYGGVKPLRTFVGPRYIGGFSDHLPVYVKLEIKAIPAKL